MADRWQPGTALPTRTKVMTAERMRWYADALETCTGDGDLPVIAPLNIHTSDEIARANGLPARVSDGMVSTNWISTLLADEVGDGYLAGGSLRTRYVRPIFEDDRIEVVVRVTERTSVAEGRARVTAEVACVKPDGQVATGGTATFIVAS
jgi:acyl dehydratase